jgi:deoxyribodipyrimidine photo-lyase
MKNAIFWFRRDLRLDDNAALNQAIASGFKILPLFIFDTNILDELKKDDPRVSFIYDQLKKIHESGIEIKISKGKPTDILKELCEEFPIDAIFCNRDYEPYAQKRDSQVENWAKSHNIEFHCLKDQVIFDRSEITKADGKPYTVFTPYKNKWLEEYSRRELHSKHNTTSQRLTSNDLFHPSDHSLGVHETGIQKQQVYSFPDLKDLGFSKSTTEVLPYSLNNLGNYQEVRDFPAENGGSFLGPHLRFGTVSIRKIVLEASMYDSTFLSELIWREFFMQILYHFPDVVKHNFKRQYDGINWRNNEIEFQKWCLGQTGYPMVDAGMRELNQTGYIHNRVRMVTASFLCKHLLIDWRWGEAYFAEKLLDYELSSNNGNWQWAAGTGCDAAPYFRVFNPYTQQEKFDPQYRYIKKWVPEFNSSAYQNPLVEHKFARERAIEVYKKGLTVKG